MDRSSLGLAPTSPRPTMRALLITACLLATVPSAEALASLPSISSSTGIAMAVVSVAAALSLVAGLAFVLGWIKKRLGRKRKSTDQENVESGQSSETDSDSPVVFSMPLEENEFNEFLQGWNDHSIDEKDKFIAGMVKEFPVAVTPAMAMAVLQKMLEEEVHAQLWMRMLRFIMMLERDLFKWDLRKEREECLTTPTRPRRTHDQFQTFLIAKAEDILHKVGDVAGENETAEAGFMRFVAYLFGFVCKYGRITDLMDDLWTKHGLTMTDASRAMVWGYRRWNDDRRFKCRPTATKPNGNHKTFTVLMEALTATAPGSPRTVGTKAQHLLFALGCGYEPDPTEGPLAYMSDPKNQFAKYFCPMDYLWLMMGRDLVMGNAWHWICDKELTEHNRMCNFFGYKSKLYQVIVDMVMKYEEEYDYYENNLDRRREKMAVRYPGGFNFEFNKHCIWYTRYKREKSAISLGINDWLMENTEQGEVKKSEAGTGTSTIRVAEVAASSSNTSNSETTRRKQTPAQRRLHFSDE